MPFSLLLQATMKPLTDAADLLAPWERIALLETQILERARSTFLVHWFGSATPITGLSVSVAIANAAELQERFGLVNEANRALAARSPEGVDGPGLLEPLSGIAGGLAGAFFAPGGSMMLSIVVARVQRGVVGAVIASLNWLSFGLLGTAVGLVALIPATAIAFGSLTPAQLRLVAAAGPLLIAARRLWDQINGPRDRVLNPVLRAALQAGDALAGLVPFLLAAFATAVTRIGPELESLAMQFIRLYDLGRTLVDMLRFIGTDLTTRLTDTLTGPHGIHSAIEGVFSALGSSFSHTGRWLLETFTDLAALGVADRAVVDAAVSGWWLRAEPEIRSLTVDSPLISAMKTFATELGIVADAWKHSARPSTPSPPGPFGLAMAALLSRPGPPFPTFPAISPFPVTGGPAGAIAATGAMLNAADTLLPGAIANPLALDDASLAALAAARRPGGVFAGRAEALRRSITPEERERRRQAQRDLEAYTTMAERLVGPTVGSELPRLDSILAELHDTITGERTARRLPVRLLDDRPALRPHIRRLRVRVAGGDRAAADAWSTLVRSRLQAPAASVPVGG